MTKIKETKVKLSPWKARFSKQKIDSYFLPKIPCHFT